MQGRSNGALAACLSEPAITSGLAAAAQKYDLHACIMIDMLPIGA